jgi:hypothetical protein
MSSSILFLKSQCYNFSIMTYDVGTHVDLTHLNKKLVISTRVEKRTFPPQSVRKLYEVGTQFIFSQNKAARRIPVAFA